MKQISMLLAALALWLPPRLPAQDAATQERLDKLSGQIDGLIEGQQALKKQVDALARDLDNLREQVGKPTGNYATMEQLKGLVKSIEEVDQKRVEDAKTVRNELLKLGRSLSAPAPASKRTIATDQPENSNSQKANQDDSGFWHVVKSGDTLSTISQAYREKNIKVSVEQIIKANPGLKPESLRVGKKIWIPAPQS
jgi:LysM repeat protein